MPDTLKLKRATKSIANQSTKVLEKDEVLAVTPDSGSGKGKYQFRFGDGVTPAKDLPIAIDGENVDDMKVSTFTTPSDENPVLSVGDTIKLFAGKIKKKFTYLENLVGNIRGVTNLFGTSDPKTVAQGLQNLVNTKFDKSNVYTGLDSTSTTLAASGEAVRQVNVKCDNNASAINQLNSNLDNHLCMFPNGTTAVQSQSANTWRRLQIQTVNDDIAVYKSTDGGQTWPSVKVLISNADIAPLNSQHVGHINYSIPDKVNIVLWDRTTIDTPFKTGQTIYGNGFCLTLTTGSQVANDQWMCQLAMAVGDSHLFTRHCRGGVWSGWTAIGSPAI